MSLLERLEPYDLLAAGIPGTLLITWIAICYPVVGATWAVAATPEAFQVIALAAAAVFIGQLTVGLASLLESALYATWGGRPSDLALQGKRPGIIDPESAEKLLRILRKAFGETASVGSLFIRALRLADSEAGSLTPRFNALYAYQRSLLCFLTLSLAIFVTSTRWGGVAEWPSGLAWTVLAVIVGSILLTWHRARQRADYLVREALTTAQKVLGSAAKSS